MADGEWFCQSLEPSNANDETNIDNLEITYDANVSETISHVFDTHAFEQPLTVAPNDLNIGPQGHDPQSTLVATNPARENQQFLAPNWPDNNAAAVGNIKQESDNANYGIEVRDDGIYRVERVGPVGVNYPLPNHPVVPNYHPFIPQQHVQVPPADGAYYPPVANQQYSEQRPIVDIFAAGQRVNPNTSDPPRRRLPSPIVLEDAVRLRRPSCTPDGERLRNDKIPRITRKQKTKPDPKEWYGPPQPSPQPWGPRKKDSRFLFRYTEYGELERNKTFTLSEMRRYLYGPIKDDKFVGPKRLPGVNSVKDKLRQGLTLWIGWVPPQSNERYPSGTQSQRCRFADCADPNHTIRTGFPRVILDERMNEKGEVVDPYYNAGYVHLYCLERHFDIVDAIMNLDVRLDERNFDHDENLGKLSRGLPEIRTEVDNWFQREYAKWCHGIATGHKRDREDYSSTLSHTIVSHSLTHSGHTRAKMREERGGADMSKHKGDLKVQRFLKLCKAEGVVDDNGDPLPGAVNLLKQKLSAKKGKRKQRPQGISLPSESGSPNQQSNGCEVEFSPMVFSSRTPYDPSNTHIPMPNQLSPAQSFDYDQMLISPNLDLSLEPFVDRPPLELPSVGPHSKRGRDAVVAEDQAIDVMCGRAQEPVQEAPSKKQRSEPQILMDPKLPVERGEIPDQANQLVQDVGGAEELLSGEDSLLPSFESESIDGSDISELDDDLVFDIINREIPDVPRFGTPNI